MKELRNQYLAPRCHVLTEFGGGVDLSPPNVFMAHPQHLPVAQTDAHFNAIFRCASNIECHRRRDHGLGGCQRIRGLIKQHQQRIPFALDAGAAMPVNEGQKHRLRLLNHLQKMNDAKGFYRARKPHQVGKHDGLCTAKMRKNRRINGIAICVGHAARQ